MASLETPRAKRDWMEYAPVRHNVSDKAELKAALEAGGQAPADATPYGVLLRWSDSSVISAITSAYAARWVERRWQRAEARWPQLHSFASVWKGRRAAAARKVADTGTIHHPRSTSPQAGLDTADATITSTYRRHHHPRAHPTMVCYIKAMGIRFACSAVALLTSGSAGYPTSHKAPNAREFYEGRTCASSPPLHLS